MENLIGLRERSKTDNCEKNYKELLIQAKLSFRDQMLVGRLAKSILFPRVGWDPKFKLDEDSLEDFICEPYVLVRKNDQFIRSGVKFGRKSAINGINVRSTSNLLTQEIAVQDRMSIEARAAISPELIRAFRSIDMSDDCDDVRLVRATDRAHDIGAMFEEAKAIFSQDLHGHLTAAVDGTLALIQEPMPTAVGI